MRRVSDVAGQVIVITGAARGIGALTARRLAAHGARVALLGLEPGELAHGCAACGPAARWWQVDVTDEQALAGTAGAVQAAYGRIDAVVVNAGIAIGGPFRYSDARSFARVIEINLLGSVRPRVPSCPPCWRAGATAADSLAGRDRPSARCCGLLREQVRGRGLREAVRAEVA